nr:Crp/Fnr family transcriptional regulator [Methylobacterium sp.]
MASGARAECLHLVISGVVARCRRFADGRRQITALILPGDVCDLADHIRGGNVLDHVTLSDCRIGEIPRSALFADGGLRPEWSEFAIRMLAREGEIATEWIVSLARRSAYEAAAHLFCELWVRMDAAGQTDGQSFAFALTQADLGDALGMTSIHVNRTLRNLRNAGLVSVAKKRATIHDLTALRQVADFDPTYLQSNSREVTRS